MSYSQKSEAHNSAEYWPIFNIHWSAH